VIRVLVADDSPALLEAASLVVDATEGFELVGRATSGEEAVRLAATTQPDLVLLDVRMPGIGGLEAARRIHAGLPRAVLVLCSSDSSARLLGRASATIASAVLDKLSFSPRTLDALWRRHGPPGTAAPPGPGG
jgi:DNA-binding NarL/FixJ family response regulator